MPAILMVFVNLLKNIFLTMASEAFLQWGLFFFGEMLVKSTKTTKDDEFFAKLKETYEAKQKK